MEIWFQRLRDCWESEGRRQATHACSDLTRWLVGNWLVDIPREPNPLKEWYQIDKKGKTYLVHRETGKGFSPFRPDWDALKGVTTALLVVPVALGSSILHLVKGGWSELDTAQNVYALYKISRQKKGYHWANFFRMNFPKFLPHRQSCTARALRDLYCGLGTIVVGAYSLYNPLDARLYFHRIEQHWHEGVIPLSYRHMTSLGVFSSLYALLEGRISVYHVTGVKMVGKICRSPERKRNEGKSRPVEPQQQLEELRDAGGDLADPQSSSGKYFTYEEGDAFPEAAQPGLDTPADQAGVEDDPQSIEI